MGADAEDLCPHLRPSHGWKQAAGQVSRPGVQEMQISTPLKDIQKSLG